MANTFCKLLVNFIPVKKVALILLTTLYMLSTVGLAVNKFYCCGKLKSISFSWQSNEKSRCKIAISDDDCCKNTHQYLKIIDVHAGSDVVSFSEKFFSTLHLDFSFSKFNTTQTQLASTASNINSPPLLSATPIYIFICNYRI